MGIDIYLSWPKMTKKQKMAQATGFCTMAGAVGYLREAYHGGPYPSKILVREAFEAENCKARIPAAVMRERLTCVTEPVRNGAGDGAELMSGMIKKILEEIQARGGSGSFVLPVSPKEITPTKTTPMTVEEAVRERCRLLYPDMTPGAVDELVDSYRAFVTLAEEKEKKHGKPCLVYASY